VGGGISAQTKKTPKGFKKMKVIQMGLNTEPRFKNAEETIARVKANDTPDAFARWWDMWRKGLEESERLRDEIAATVEDEGACELNWSCTGATLFDCLAWNWKAAMPQYRFEISRYSCKVYKN
jgi:hypothetical protein